MESSSIILKIGLVMVLIAINAYFVATEFALVAAKRHRLELAAATGSRAARAALAERLGGNDGREETDHD